MDFLAFLQQYDLLERVITLAGGPYLTTGLRGTCSAAWHLVEKPERRHSLFDALDAAILGMNPILRDHIFGLFRNPDGAACESIMLSAGSTGNIRMFESCIAFCRMRCTIPNGDSLVNDAIVGGAQEGHFDFCRQIASNTRFQLITILKFAAAHGDVPTCEWAVSTLGDNRDVCANLMLLSASITGQEAACIVAREKYQANAIEDMLSNALEYSQFNVAELAVSWAPQIQLNPLLPKMARKANVAACKWLLDKGANNYDDMLRGGGCSGSLQICTIAIERGARDFNALAAAAGESQRNEIVDLAFSHGATNAQAVFDDSLQTPGNNWRSICLSAILHGAVPKDVEGPFKRLPLERRMWLMHARSICRPGKLMERKNRPGKLIK